MNSILRTQEFWYPLLTFEPNWMQEDIIKVLDGLSIDYPIVRNEEEYETNGKFETTVSGIVSFPFKCLNSCSMSIECSIEWGDFEKYFYFIYPDGRKQLMGWWDLAMWHPHCLRLCEFKTLIQFWQFQGYDQDLLTLLLFDFIGIENEHERLEVKELATSAYQSVLNRPEIEFPRMIHFRGDNYWSQHPRLGWVYSSKKYGCHTLRNEAHEGSEYGTFPFQEFSGLIEDISVFLRIVGWVLPTNRPF